MLFRKLFYRKPPDGLLEISERVYVFDSCFTTDAWEEENYKVHLAGIVDQLQEHFPEASVLVFNFREGSTRNVFTDALSKFDVTIMDYPRHFEGCPLLTMELLHHYLRSSESWLSLGLNNLLLMHCERGGWPVLAFMLAALLIYRKQYSGEQKTLDMMYKQAPHELLHFLSALNPIPSQLRYLQYVSRRNVASAWPPLDRALTVDCVILRHIPNFDGEGGCRPIFRIYGQDPFLESDKTAKVRYYTSKKSKNVRTYKQAECELVKIDINCHIQGDVVLECMSLHGDMERESMMFRVVFNTAFIRSNILMLNRDEIDMLWDAKDQFPRDFRVEILFSEMDAAGSVVAEDSSCFDNKEGLSEEAFATIHEFFRMDSWPDNKAGADAKEYFNQVDWSDDRIGADVAQNAIFQKLSHHLRELSPKRRQEGKKHSMSEDSFQNYISSSPRFGYLSSPMQSPNNGVSNKYASFPQPQTPPVLAPLRPSMTSDAVKTPPPPSLPPPLPKPEDSSIVKESRTSLPESEQSSTLITSSTGASSAPPIPPHFPAPVLEEESTVKVGLLTSPSPPSTPPLKDKSSIRTEPPPPPSLPPSSTPASVNMSSIGVERPSSPPPVPLYFKESSNVIARPPPPPPPPPKPSLNKCSVGVVPPSPPLPPPIVEEKSNVEAGPPPPAPPPFPSGKDSSASISSSVVPPPPPIPTLSSNSSRVPSAPPPPPMSGKGGSAPDIPPPPPPMFGKGGLAPGIPPPPPPMLGKGGSAPGIPPPPPPMLGKGGSASSIPPPPGGSIGEKSAPGPPSPAPPPVKGRLSRTISSKSQQTKKLKPLYWLKLTRAVQGSLWLETQKSGEHSKAPEIDMSELETLFSAAVPTADQGSKSGSRGLKSERVQLVDHRRAYNCEIMLSKVKVPLQDLMSSVLDLEDSALDADQVDNLIKFCPTKEEMDLLKGYNGDKEKLGKCEQFFLELMKVPRVEAKLRVFSFKIQFQTQVSDLKNSLNVVSSAAEEIKNSNKLKRVMQTILSLGNALNQGTARGSAIGFRLDSLLKLTDTRARNSKMTLMHYLCKVLADKLPKLLDFSKGLANLEAASKVQLKALAEEMQAINKGLEKVMQELSATENDGPVSENFSKILKEFLCFAEADVRTLASLYFAVGRNVNALILYFGEDPARCPFEQVVSTLLNFVRMFNRALEENFKQAELEMKKSVETEKSKLSTIHKESEQLLQLKS